LNQIRILDTLNLYWASDAERRLYPKHRGAHLPGLDHFDLACTVYEKPDSGLSSISEQTEVVRLVAGRP